jgi:RNA-binding protein 7
VSIPKEKDGKNKTFGFVTYIHELTVPYALNIFAGTKLFGRELLLKYRNSSKNTPRSSLDNQSPMSSLANPWASSMGFSMYGQQLPIQAPIFTQDMFQQQLLQMATAPDFGLGNFSSSRQDNVGSFRERSSRDDRNDRDLVDRNRNRRDENRNNRSRPYRRSRSRSRSPQHRNRDRSPGYKNDRERRRDRGGGGYNRWNY